MIKKIDILDRQPVVSQLIDLVHLIAARKKGCTFSLDGKWGSGKSFVLEMFEQQISLFQNPETADDKYILFHYNCWQYDYYEEPAIAIVAAIKNEIKKYNDIIVELPEDIKAVFAEAKDIGKKLLANFLESKLGFDPLAILERINNQKDVIKENAIFENEFDTYYRFKEVLDDTRKQLCKLASDKPVILVVDELDRCMPNYAIKVLERLHHLFDENSNIIVILAVDKAQLCRTINQIFGIGTEQTDVRMCDDYLRKFINFSVSLDNGVISDNFWTRYQYILNNYDISSNTEELYKELPNKLFYGLDIRAQERIMDRIQTLHELVFEIQRNKSNLSILYFELIYNTIMFYCPTLTSWNWLLKRNSGYPSTLDKHLESTLKELYQQATSSISNNPSGRHIYNVLSKNHIAVTFWLFATLVEKPKSQGLCLDFKLTENIPDEKLLLKIQQYHRLAQLIK